MNRTGSTSTSSAALGRTGLLGFAGGLRSQTPFGVLAAAAARGEFPKQTSGLIGLFRRRDVQLALGASAAGEMVIDKLPMVPSRLQPPALVGRFLFGGFAGALFARGNNRSVPLGFAIGAVASGAGAFAGYHARKAISDKTGLPDPIVAIGEDVLAITIAHLAVGRE